MLDGQSLQNVGKTEWKSKSNYKLLTHKVIIPDQQPSIKQLSIIKGASKNRNVETTQNGGLTDIDISSKSNVDKER